MYMYKTHVSSGLCLARNCKALNRMFQFNPLAAELLLR